MSGPSASLVLVPGLGADERLFGPQARALPGLRVVPLIEPQRDESLAAYGARMAAAFEEPRTPYVLGGVSMGGMVALEMASRLRPRGVVLIASALSGREVRHWLWLVERASRLLPTGAIGAARVLAPLATPLFQPGSAHRALFLDMLRATPTSFVRWASRAIAEWRVQRMPECPVRRIHGGRDRVITPPRGEGTVIVKGAGHLVNLTHADAVNGWLRGIVEHLCD